MSEQKSMALSYLEGIKNVDECLFYQNNYKDDSKIFSIREVIFCAYNGNCPHQSENEYLFNKLIGTAVRQCKLGNTKSIEAMLEDTGMPLFTGTSLSQLVEEKVEIREKEEVSAAVTITG